MAKYGSGSKKVTPNVGLRTNRYQYLALEDAEPNLGFTTEKVLPIKDNYYQLVSFDGGTVYDRYWQVAPAGIITGISVFDEGGIVGTGNSINKLDFRGNIITATANNFGTISTITVAPPGNDTQLIYNSGGNFAASANLTFSSNVLSVTGLGSFSQGSYNQYIRVGVASNNIIDTTSGNLVLDANSGITSIKSVLLAGITTFSGSNSSNLVTLSQTGTGNALFANGTVISGLGSIGVGTTVPTQELDVNGDIRLRGTIYDYSNQPGSTGQVLVKNIFGGLEWISQSTLQTGAGGTYTNIQYQTYAGVMGGASNFVYESITSRVGIGSTLPQYLLDVLGYSRFTGQTEIDNLRVTGVATIATLGVTGLSTTKDFRVTGVATVATLGVTGLTTAQNLIITGVSTLTTLGVSGITTTKDFRVTGVSTLGITTTTNLTAQQLYVSGISTLTGAKINNLYVGTTDNNTISTPTGNIILDSSSGTTQVKDILFVDDTTATTSTTDGALVVKGGAGIGGNVNIGGYIAIGGTFGLNGTARFSSDVTIDSSATLYVSNTTQSTNKDTGSVIIEGGIGIEKNLNVGGASSITGITTFGNKILPYVNGTQDIGSTTQKWNNIYAINVVATTFNGSFQGNADSATYAPNAGIATNIKGGSAGQIPYQSGSNTTLFTSTGTQDYLLKSNATNSPSWINPATLNVGYADNAGISTNIKGGSGGSIPYQTSANNTALLANGTVGQVLQSNGTTLAPSWTSTSSLSVNYAANAGIATNIKGGAGGSIPYQTSADNTSLLANGAAGYLLQANGTTLAPSWISPTNLTVQNAAYAVNAGIATYAGRAGLTTYAQNAGIATNIKGGAGGSIPYQTSVDNTSLLANGTVGQLLQSNGTTLAPSWISPTNLTVQNAAYAVNAGVATYAVNAGLTTYAVNAGIATNIKGGAGGEIPYQSSVNNTSLLANGTSGYILQANGGTSAPSWVTPTNLTVNRASYADNAGIATNIKGGAGGSIPYQSSLNNTALLANGSVGQLLQSNGGTASPSWVSPSGLTVQYASYSINAGLSTNIKGGGSYYIPYQLSSDNTAFLAPGTTGYLLQSNGSSNPPSWVVPTNLTVDRASYADNAGLSTNIKGGAGGSIPYQSSVNNTALLANGTVGQVLQSQGGTLAPIWVSPTSLTASKAAYADNAGISTNIKGGAGGSIPYQTSADNTSFIANGTAGYILQANGGTSVPTWVNATNITVTNSSVASYAQNAGIATNVKGGSAGQIPYQTATNITSFVTTGIAGYVLQSNGTSAPSWINPAGAGGITAVTSNYANFAGISTHLKGGNGGSIPYQTAGDSTAMLANGTAGQLLASNGSTNAPTWVNPTNLTVSNSTTSGTATNLAGGSAGTIPYQNGSNSTSFTSVGSAGQVLQSNGAGAPTWVNPTSTSTTSTIGSGSANQGYFITFVAGTGNQSILTDGDLSYNPSTNIITVPKINLTNILSGATTIATYSTNGQQVTSFGVGTPPSGTAGEIRATNNITAYYSDERLKENIKPIPSALSKLLALRGVTFNSNKTAEQYGYFDKKEQVGVIAQDVEAVLPQIVVPAPFDIAKDEDGNEYSKSGENYKTVQYDKLVPLLIEAIKEQQDTITNLQKRIEFLENQ